MRFFGLSRAAIRVLSQLLEAGHLIIAACRWKNFVANRMAEISHHALIG